ncbi:hypothetical protein QQS21_005357 [Conoideocrella luteorostrata]|uniref:Uncharacterized protein n=1 Tax=Conoideocrella luteorostrata TaxID=1105319 RepID=A0AAJ0G0Z4_9HYPO|nr:hypothetical protein QQS21_005357 [Conoideocrella luteorostrata]
MGTASIPLLALPIELVLHIGRSVPSDCDLNHLARCCRLLHHHLNAVLYTRDKEHFGGSSLRWAVSRDVPETVYLAVRFGSDARLVKPSLLHYAAMRGHARVMEPLLMHCHLDVAALDDRGSTPLLHAVTRGGNPEAARMLLKHGANPNQASDEGETPLHAAAQANLVEMAALLLQHGADMTLRYKSNRTPLHIAASCGHTEMVQLLLDDGADPALVDSANLTAFELAIYCGGHVDAAKALVKRKSSIDEGSDSGLRLLVRAVTDCNAKLVQLLLEHDVSPNTNDPKSDHVPLYKAAWKGDVDIVRLLLKHGAEVNIRCWAGDTPLHEALRSKHLDVVRQLLEAGAKPTVANDEGIQPLHLAVDLGDTAIVKELLSRGADVAVTKEDGWTPLANAAMEGHNGLLKELLENGGDVRQVTPHGPLLCAVAGAGNTEAVRLLLSHGADVSEADENGRTALQDAVEDGNIDMVKMLVQHGADVSVADVDGYMPLQLAVQGGSVQVAKFLVEKGSDMNCITKGWTPLTMASANGGLDLVKCLLEKGADVEFASDNGNTPLLVAAENGHMEVFQMLLKHGANITARNAQGHGPAHLAAMRGHSEFLEELLRGGQIEADQQDIDGRTALHLASMRGNFDAIKVLLKAALRPAVNVKDRYGATALIMAARNGHADAISMLLEVHGLSVDERDSFGRTALQWTSRCAEPEAQTLLVSFAGESSKKLSEDEEEDCANKDVNKVEFRSDSCFCDVCGRCTTNESYGNAHECHSCCPGEGDYLLICSECAEAGMKCRSAEHEWSPHECSCEETNDSDDGSHSSCADTNDSNSGSYTAQEFGEIFRDFYSFLTTLHYDPAKLKLPPPDGWPHMTDKYCAGFKSDFVIDVMRHLPYFQRDSESAAIHYKSWLVDYSAWSTKAFKKGDQAVDEMAFVDKDGDPVDAQDVFYFAEGRETYGRYMWLIPRDGTVVEELVRSNDEDMGDIKSYFEDLKGKYQSLRLIPCVGRITIEAEEVEEHEEEITKEEVYAQAEEWGTDLDIQFVRQLYRQFGWPMSFDKDAARGAVDELFEEMPEERGSWQTDDYW